MGRISNIKAVNEEKVTITLEVTQKEAQWLQGNLDKMHLFSENNLEHETRLVQRGKKESTKYLLIPKPFRKEVRPSNNVKCNRIETKNKDILIFSINKF